MTPKPPEIRITRHVDTLWLQSLRWLTGAYHEYSLGGPHGLPGNYRVFANDRFLCHVLRSALPPHRRQDLFPLLMNVARNKASDTKRLRNAGGGERGLKLDGTPSVYARPRKLLCLKNAREGIFGFQGVSQGGGCGPCAFNRERPEEYRQLVEHCEFIGELFREHEPRAWQRHMDITSRYRHLLIGNTGWSQGVGNWCFPMAMHCDSGNVEGSISASTVCGDYDGGPLIFPGYGLAVFLEPGDLLLFDGRAAHGLGLFSGARLSLVLYLNRGILHCPSAASEGISTTD